MGSQGLGQLAYDKRIRILTASQSTQTASENASTRMGILTYSLVKNGLQDGNADWERHDGKIFLCKWLRYGVKRVPTLYDDIRTGNLDSNAKAPGTSEPVHYRSLFVTHAGPFSGAKYAPISRHSHFETSSVPARLKCSVSA